MQQLLWSRGNGRELGTDTNSCRIIFYSCLMLFLLDIHVLVFWYLRTVSYVKHNFMGLGWGEHPWVTRRFPALLGWAAWRALPLDWEKTAHFLWKRYARNSHQTFWRALGRWCCWGRIQGDTQWWSLMSILCATSQLFKVQSTIFNRNAIVTLCGGYLR